MPISMEPHLEKHEHLLFRRPRESPGWFPGGRFLVHQKSEELVTDMQEREMYHARKLRERAREVDRQRKREMETKRSSRSDGLLPSMFAQAVQISRETNAEKIAQQEIVAAGGSLKAKNRDEMLDISRNRLIVELDQYKASKGRRRKDIELFCYAKERTIQSLTRTPQIFCKGETIVLHNEGARYEIKPKARMGDEDAS
mmetsp:Transcript_17724/g.43033  ORF Transcript_17724/g.43033 Transcript_17724/m.43033 type:complete len:199 (+) Transcript_17724:268-864(+)